MIIVTAEENLDVSSGLLERDEWYMYSVLMTLSVWVKEVLLYYYNISYITVHALDSTIKQMWKYILYIYFNYHVLYTIVKYC